jgi:hypothetical protein
MGRSWPRVRDADEFDPAPSMECPTAVLDQAHTLLDRHLRSLTVEPPQRFPEAAPILDSARQNLTLDGGSIHAPILRANGGFPVRIGVVSGQVQRASTGRQPRGTRACLESSRRTLRRSALTSTCSCSGRCGAGQRSRQGPRSQWQPPGLARPESADASSCPRTIPRRQAVPSWTRTRAATAPTISQGGGMSPVQRRKWYSTSPRFVGPHAPW